MSNIRRNTVTYRVLLASGEILQAITVPYPEGEEGQEFEDALMLLVRAAFKIGKYEHGDFLSGRDGIVLLTRTVW